MVINASESGDDMTSRLSLWNIDRSGEHGIPMGHEEARPQLAFGEVTTLFTSLANLPDLLDFYSQPQTRRSLRRNSIGDEIMRIGCHEHLGQRLPSSRWSPADHDVRTHFRQQVGVAS